jgi:hypothetical protein
MARHLEIGDNMKKCLISLSLLSLALLVAGAFYQPLFVVGVLVLFLLPIISGCSFFGDCASRQYRKLRGR